MSLIDAEEARVRYVVEASVGGAPVRDGVCMSLSELATLAERPSVQLISTDLFDTILLRDDSTQTGRLAEACKRSASSLGLDVGIVRRLRWWLQDDAYRAVAIGRTSGEARLTSIYDVIAMVLGLDPAAAAVMHDIEVDTDIGHLRPNRPLLELLQRIAEAGTRIIAVSDTYYSSASLEHMLATVVGPHPIQAVYSSADLGRTKHVGLIFDAVASTEGISPENIIHVGDDHVADIVNARQAAWTAVHLARTDGVSLRRTARRASDVLALVRRMQ